MDDKQRIQADKEIIEFLGGPTRVAELLGFDKAKGGSAASSKLDDAWYSAKGKNCSARSFFA